MFFKIAAKLSSVMSEDNPSLIEELFEYIKTKYFSFEFGEYSHVSVDSDSLSTIVFCFFIGMNIAALLTIFNKRVLGDFIRSLISNECLSPEKAKTLSELGFLKNSAVRGSLRSGVSLRRVVRCVEEEEYKTALAAKRQEFERTENGAIEGVGAGGENTTGKDPDYTDVKGKKFTLRRKRSPGGDFREAPYSIDLNSAHFYIPDELKYTAEIKFEKKGTNLLSFFAVLIVSAILVVLFFRFAPDIFQLIDNFITGISPDSGY